MLHKSFVILTIHLVILSVIAFSTGSAHPIPASTSGGTNDLKLMGRVVTYFNHNVALVPPFTASIILRDPDEFPVTRAERFRHQLNWLRQYMLKSTATHASVTATDE